MSEADWAKLINDKLMVRNISPTIFSAWLGVKPTTLNLWLSGEAMPDRAMQAEISKLLGIPFKPLPDPAPRGDLTELEAELLSQFRALSPRLQQVALLQIIALHEADDD